MRHISPIDKMVLLADNVLKTLSGGAQTTPRANPAENLAKPQLDSNETRHSAGLMRINHCGEVCAQALYQGQALTARLPEVRDKMHQAALEENDHLDWCATRLKELDSHTSIFNPLWYAGSFGLGALAGALGDKWSLGFVAETEHQVVAHLQNHLTQLPSSDEPSRVILETMKTDELEHATAAINAGGAELPRPVKSVMGLMSKVMTSSVYYL